MLSNLGTLIWLRWRLIVNMLKSPGRSLMERGSQWIGALLSALLSLAFVGFGLFVGGAFFFAAAKAAGGVDETPLLIAIRTFAGISILFAVILPMGRAELRPSGSASQRLELVPISRRHVLVGEILASAVDPWMLAIAPLMLLFPLGLAWGGRGAAGLISGCAGLLFLLVLAALGLTVARWLAWILASRRRAETASLIGLILLISASFLPVAFDPQDHNSEELAWMLQVISPLPSELHGKIVSAAFNESMGDAILPFLGLGLELLVILVLLGLAPDPARLGGASRKSGPAEHPVWAEGHLAGDLGAQAFATALNFLRTVRGRLAMVMTPLLATIFSVVAKRNDELAIFVDGSTIGAWVILLGVLTLQPVQMNQFGVDGLGLGRTFLSPISARRILLGRVIGTAVLGLASTLPALALAAIIYGGGHPAQWLAMAVGMAAIFIPMALYGALTSVLLPKASDLTNLGNKGNAHQVAVFGGILAAGLAAAPVIATIGLLGRLMSLPWLALLGVCVWTVLVGVVAWFAMPAIAELFDRRREQILDVASTTVS